MLITATVINNNLNELYTLYDLAAPGCLNTRSEFAVDAIHPIAAGRADGASSAVVEMGEIAAADLGKVTTKLMLRRTSEELERDLPDKHTLLLVCRPTDVQRKLHAALASDETVLAPFDRLRMLRSLHHYPGLLCSSEGGAGSTLYPAGG